MSMLAIRSHLRGASGRLAADLAGRVAAATAGGALLLRLAVLPVLERGQALVEPNLGTAVAGQVALAAGSWLVAACTLVLLLAFRARLAAGSGLQTGPATAGWMAAWLLKTRLWPALYEAYATVDRVRGEPRLHALHAERLHVTADAVLAAFVLLMAAVAFFARRRTDAPCTARPRTEPAGPQRGDAPAASEPMPAAGRP